MSPRFTEDELAAAALSGATSPDDDGPFAGYETEHIYIGDESLDSGDKPRTVSQRIRIRNLARGVISELTFYAEGFLRVREDTHKQLVKDHTLELRFVDPDPETDRSTASGWLWTIFGLLTLTVGSHFILPTTDLAGYAFATTTVLGTLGTLALLLFIYKSEERIRFCTASGRAEVLILVSSFGCKRKMRRAARAIQASIGAAGGGSATHDVRYLRAEMQAHYKLRETGVISPQVCAASTAQILSRFG